MDLLSDALSSINNAERVGKMYCRVRKSNLIKNVLAVVEKCGYIGKVHEEDKNFVVSLIGKINKIGAIRPRFSVKKDQYEKFEKRFLPAKGVGFLVVSTSKGVITQEEAKKKNLGGKLLAYVY